jgi:hypothetical protein
MPLILLNVSHTSMHQLRSLIPRHQRLLSRTPRPVRPRLLHSRHHRLHHPDRHHPPPRRGRGERCGSNKRSGNEQMSAITSIHGWLVWVLAKKVSTGLRRRPKQTAHRTAARTVGILWMIDSQTIKRSVRPLSSYRRETVQLEYHGSSRALHCMEISRKGRKGKKQAYKRVQRREQIRDSAQNLRVEDLSVSQLGADCKASKA